MNDEELIYNTINNNSPDILNLPRWQLDLTQELFKFKLQLLGLIPNDNYGFKIKDPQSNETFNDMREFIPVPGANLVNERGATAIHNKLSGELTKIPSDTNINAGVIETELIAFEYDFPVWLANNYADFELSDKDYDSICETAVRLVKFAFYRSIGGWKGALINNNVQQREVIQSTNNTEVQQNKQGWLNLWGR